MSADRHRWHAVEVPKLASAPPAPSVRFAPIVLIALAAAGLLVGANAAFGTLSTTLHQPVQGNAGSVHPDASRDSLAAEGDDRGEYAPHGWAAGHRPAGPRKMKDLPHHHGRE